MKKFIVSSILALLYAICAFAQEDQAQNNPSTWQKSPIIELQPGKKLMKVADLELSDNTSLADLLFMFPELMQRTNIEVLSLFDLQIEDVSTGASKETFLEQLRASDIKEIELSVNPTTSTQINGQGGVINVTLNNAPKGFSGSVLLEASTTWDVTPAVKLFYSTDKLQLFGSLSGEYFCPRNDDSSVQKFYPGGERIYTESTDKEDYGYGFASVSLLYKFNDKSKLKAWLWQSHSAESHEINSVSDDMKLISESSTLAALVGSSVTGGLKYSYDSKKWCFETQLDYTYNPGQNKRIDTIQDTLLVCNYYDWNRPHDLSFLAKTKIILIPETERQKCELSIGANVKYSPKEYSFIDEEQASKQKLAVNTNSIYVSPYAEVNSMFGPIFLKAGLRYQFFQYDIIMKGQDEYKKPVNKMTAFLNFGWQPAVHHHLSMILDKSLRRPDNQQVYPGRYYDPGRGGFIRGNSNLLAEDIYTASVDYQYDFSKNGYSVLAGSGLRYNHFRNAITDVEPIGGLPTYDNTGKGDKIAFNLMGMYGHGPFKIFLTGGLIQNWYDTGFFSDSSLSYTITATPILSFSQGNWRINGRFEYTSPVKSKLNELGQYFYSEVRLSKGFKKWTFYMELSDNFHRLVEDRSYASDGSVAINSHYLYFPGFGLGASLKF